MFHFFTLFGAKSVREMFIFYIIGFTLCVSDSSEINDEQSTSSAVKNDLQSEKDDYDESIINNEPAPEKQAATTEEDSISEEKGILNEEIPEFEIPETVGTVKTLQNSYTKINVLKDIHLINEGQFKKIHTNDKHPLKDIEAKRAKFTISSVIPTIISTKGNERITVYTNLTNPTFVFCRFNTKVYNGRYNNGEIICKTPILAPGEVNLSISVDKRKWCDDFVLHVINEENNRVWIVVCIAIVFISFVSYMLFKFLFLKRKVPKRKNFRNTNDSFFNLNKVDNEAKKLKRRRAQIEP